jgi:hypothetical protein
MIVLYFKNNHGIIEWSNKRELFDYLLSNEDYKGEFYAEIDKLKGKRSVPQNNSLHLWCEQVAEALNDSGQLLKITIGGKTAEIDWTGANFKENVWRPVQKALTGKKSTTKLDKLEPSKVYDHINRFLAERCNGIHIPWPSEEAVKDTREMPSYPTESNKTAF